MDRPRTRPSTTIRTSSRCDSICIIRKGHMKPNLNMMHVRRVAFGLAFALAASVAYVRPTAAQAPGASGDSQLSIGVSMPVTVPVTGPLPPKNAVDRPMTIWRSYVPLEELRLNVSLANESDSPLWLSRSELRNAIQFGVQRNGTPLAVSARWLD